MNYKCIDCKKEYTARKENIIKRCRRCNIYFRRKEKWNNRIKNHRCGDCGKKIRPKVIYPHRCKECNKKINGK